jgi:hypothetical protein
LLFSPLKAANLTTICVKKLRNTTAGLYKYGFCNL